jgi:hypothetical protein
VPLNRTLQFVILALLSIIASNALAQGASARRPHRRRDITASNAWAFTAVVDGYFTPGEEGYADPIFTADHNWLHLEARYNYEDLRTGSVWFGYNFNYSAGKNPDKKLDLTFTPMIGGVFGRTAGISPGSEASLTYKKLNLWVSEQYVFDTRDRSGSYFYTWPQLTYTPVDWLRVGLVAQRTQAAQSSTQGGFLVGLTHKKVDFTSYILDPSSNPTVVLELGYSF